MNKKFKRFLIIFVSVCLFLSLLLSFFVIGDKVALGFERFSPDYDKIDLIPFLTKSELSEDDYSVIYKQTGLTKIGVDSTLKRDGISGVLAIQDSVFCEYTVKSDVFGPFCHYYFLDKRVPMAPLQDGDIIVSSSTEFSWWTLGHCAMVVDAEKGIIVEAVGVGDKSHHASVSTLYRRGDFMILRPNCDKETLQNVIDYIEESLVGTKYDPTIGVLSRKYDPEIEYTQCAHIFWYAFFKFGINIDSNGGTVVTPKNIANSKHFDIVQVSGFDFNTLWN